LALLLRNLCARKKSVGVDFVKAPPKKEKGVVELNCIRPHNRKKYAVSFEFKCNRVEHAYAVISGPHKKPPALKEGELLGRMIGWEGTGSYYAIKKLPENIEKEAVKALDARVEFKKQRLWDKEH